MEKTLGELLQIRDRRKVPEDLAGYLEKLGEELQRIIGDIDRVAGKPAPNSVPVG
jgi:hypothetical protein